MGGGEISNLHFRQNHAAVDFHPLICGLDSRLCTRNKNTRLYVSRTVQNVYTRIFEWGWVELALSQLFNDIKQWLQRKFTD